MAGSEVRRSRSASASRSAIVMRSRSSCSLSADGRSVPRADHSPPALSKALDPVIDALFARFDPRPRMEHVRFIDAVLAAAGQPRIRRDDRSRARATRRVRVSRSHRDRRHRGPGGVRRGVSEQRTRLGPLDRHARDRPRWPAGRGRAVEGDKSASRSASIRFRRRPEASSRSSSTSAAAIRTQDYAGKMSRARSSLGDADAGQLWRRGGHGPRRDWRHLAARSVRTSLPIRRARSRRRARRGTFCSGAAFRTTRRRKASASKPRRAR